MLTGGQPWNDPSSQFDPNGLYSNVWIIILLAVAVLMASAYFPAISGRLGDSSSLGVDEKEKLDEDELEKQAEFHGSTMSIQQTIMSVSEIIGIILGGIALLVVFAITKGDDTNFAYNIVGILVPIIVLLILTAIATFLWPAEDEFVETAKVRRRKETKQK